LQQLGACEIAGRISAQAGCLGEDLATQLDRIDGGAFVEFARVEGELEQSAGQAIFRRTSRHLAPGFEQGSTRKSDVCAHEGDGAGRQLAGAWELGFGQRHDVQVIAATSDVDEVSGKQRGRDASCWSWIRWFRR
jgi:hypothetical protein